MGVFTLTKMNARVSDYGRARWKIPVRKVMTGALLQRT